MAPITCGENHTPGTVIRYYTKENTVNSVEETSETVRWWSAQYGLCRQDAGNNRTSKIEDATEACQKNLEGVAEIGGRSLPKYQSV